MHRRAVRLSRSRYGPRTTGAVSQRATVRQRFAFRSFAANFCAAGMMGEALILAAQSAHSKRSSTPGMRMVRARLRLATMRIALGQTAKAYTITTAGLV